MVRVRQLFNIKNFVKKKKQSKINNPVIFLKDQRQLLITIIKRKQPLK